MENTALSLSSNQTASSFQPSQSFFKTHKTAIIAFSLGFVVLLGMIFYIVSPGRKTLVSPATKEKLPIISPLPAKKIKNTPTLAPALTITPTINPIVAVSWKTYTNRTYGYNIKYPPDWINRDLGALETKIPSYIAFNTTSASSSARHITISVTTRTYQEQLALGASSSAVTYAGIKGTKQYFQDSDGNTSTIVILPRKNNLLVLRTKTAYLSIFNLMLTTLKLTN